MQNGLFNAITCFLVWGLSPLYWNLVQGISPWELLAHRVVWAFIMLFGLVLLLDKKKELKKLFSKQSLKTLSWTTLLLCFNWILFIYAVTHGHVLDVSLGYFLNPLLSMALARIFLDERLNPQQKIAVTLAASSILLHCFYHSQNLWISLGLGGSFAFYGLLRKKGKPDPLAGLTVETLFLILPASFFLFFLEAKSVGSFQDHAFFLIGTGLITLIPLLTFNQAAKKLRLTTVGFVQFSAPTIQFFLGVFYFKENLELSTLFVFIVLWMGVAFYCYDSLTKYFKV